MKKMSKKLNSFPNWSDKKLQKEYLWLNSYLNEVVSRSDVVKLELMERELQRRGYSIDENHIESVEE